MSQLQQAAAERQGEMGIAVGPAEFGLAGVEAGAVELEGETVQRHRNQGDAQPAAIVERGVALLWNHAAAV